MKLRCIQNANATPAVIAKACEGAGNDVIVHAAGAAWPAQVPVSAVVWSPEVVLEAAESPSSPAELLVQAAMHTEDEKTLLKLARHANADEDVFLAICGIDPNGEIEAGRNALRSLKERHFKLTALVSEVEAGLRRFLF